MSCYRPNAVVYANGSFSRFAGKYTDALADAYKDMDGAELIQIPCGKCAGCRLDRSKSWADRMLLEFVTPREDMPVKTALFLTLTYDDLHVPGVMCTDNTYRYTLRPDDSSRFIKQLRNSFRGKRIRFYIAGEYGDTTFRPHYHAIVYGMSLADFPDAYVYSQSPRTGDILFESPKLDSIWQYGAVRFSAATYQTFCYVGRYVVKKQFQSDGGNMWYKGRVPPFARMSLKPGIGSDYFGEDWDSPKAFVSDGRDVHQIGLPRCVLQKLHLTNPEVYDIIMSNRRDNAAGHTELIKQSIDVPYMDYLRQCEVSHLEKTKLLRKRSGV